VLLQATGGLPLLVEDLLSDAAAGGVLRHQEDRWVADLPDRDPGTGGRFAQIVRRRLASLSPSARQVVEVAAVLGEPFDPAWVAAVVGGDPAVTPAIVEAVDAHLLDADGVSFRQAMTRRVVLESVVQSRLAGAGDGCPCGASARPAVDVGRVACQLETTAGNHDEAARRLRDVASQARRQGAPRLRRRP
jgi:hypothetical protein